MKRPNQSQLALGNVLRTAGRLIGESRFGDLPQSNVARPGGD
jgi:hypothetical protein